MRELLLAGNKALKKWRAGLLEKSLLKDLTDELKKPASVELYGRIASALISQLSSQGEENALPYGEKSGMQVGLVAFQKGDELAQDPHTDRPNAPAYWTVALGPRVTTSFSGGVIPRKDAAGAPAWNGDEVHAGIASEEGEFRAFLVLMRGGSIDKNAFGRFEPIANWHLEPREGKLVDSRPRLPPRLRPARSTQTQVPVPDFPEVLVPALSVRDSEAAAGLGKRRGVGGLRARAVPALAGRNPYCVRVGFRV